MDMDMVWMYSRRERVREINWKLLCLASLVKTNKHQYKLIVWWLNVLLFHKLGCVGSKGFSLPLSEGCFISRRRTATIGHLILDTFIGRERHISMFLSKWEPLFHLLSGVTPLGGGHLWEDSTSSALCKVAARKTEKSL